MRGRLCDGDFDEGHAVEVAGVVATSQVPPAPGAAAVIGVVSDVGQGPPARGRGR